MAKVKETNVKAVEFAGVGSIPYLVIQQKDGAYKHVPIRTGVTNLSDIGQEEE